MLLSLPNLLGGFFGRECKHFGLGTSGGDAFKQFVGGFIGWVLWYKFAMKRFGYNRLSEFWFFCTCFSMVSARSLMPFRKAKLD
ncbi:hypothetical protein A8139_16925 [Marinomonas primoryensis]|uniref:Uncharacterized protein n=2 Tax=Marinomonas primoryensis TaxID=178399 RepID=A0A2Z4PV18_9GAMM|nr:hypothetical protein A8139_16925 [Marinomonas primoryensis]